MPRGIPKNKHPEMYVKNGAAPTASKVEAKSAEKPVKKKPGPKPGFKRKAKATKLRGDGVDPSEQIDPAYAGEKLVGGMKLVAEGPDYDAHVNDLKDELLAYGERKSANIFKTNMETLDQHLAGLSNILQGRPQGEEIESLVFDEMKGTLADMKTLREKQFPGPWKEAAEKAVVGLALASLGKHKAKAEIKAEVNLQAEPEAAQEAAPVAPPVVAAPVAPPPTPPAIPVNGPVGTALPVPPFASKNN